MNASGGEMALPSSDAGDPVAVLSNPKLAHPVNASLRAQAVIELQRKRGNAGVQRLLTSRAIQPRLSVGSPSDGYEREANREAHQAPRMPDPRLDRQAESPEKEELEQDGLTQGERVADTTSEVEPELERRIAAVRRGGRPLPESERDFFEPRFGSSFGNVRIYTDAEAAQTAEDLDAQAYTVEQDIVFGEGRYAPETTEGKTLIAHELAHVLQQRGNTGERRGSPEGIARVPLAGSQSSLEGTTEVQATPPLSPQEIVDGYLFRGYYEQWLTLERDKREQVQRAHVNEKRFPEFTHHLYFSSRHLQKIAWDHQKMIWRIVAGQDVDPTRVEQLYNIYAMAVDAVRLYNQAFDAAFAGSWFAFPVLVSMTVIQGRASRLQELLVQLKVMLEKAQDETTGAYVEAVLNTAVTVTTFLLPPVGVATRAAIFVGQWMADDLFGPSTSKQAEVGEKATLSAGHVAERLSEIEKLGEKTRTFAGRAGKVCMVTGFFFDANEILQGYENEAQVERALSLAKTEYDQVVAQIRSFQPLLARFRVQYASILSTVSTSLENAHKIRQGYLEEATRTGYSFN